MHLAYITGQKFGIIKKKFFESSLLCRLGDHKKLIFGIYLVIMKIFHLCKSYCADIHQYQFIHVHMKSWHEFNNSLYTAHLKSLQIYNTNQNTNLRSSAFGLL